jgi:hypothetical protein
MPLYLALLKNVSKKPEVFKVLSLLGEQANVTSKGYKKNPAAKTGFCFTNN